MSASSIQCLIKYTNWDDEFSGYRINSISGYSISSLVALSFRTDFCLSNLIFTEENLNTGSLSNNLLKSLDKSCWQYPVLGFIDTGVSIYDCITLRVIQISPSSSLNIDNTRQLTVEYFPAIEAFMEGISIYTEGYTISGLQLTDFLIPCTKEEFYAAMEKDIPELKMPTTWDEAFGVPEGTIQYRLFGELMSTSLKSKSKGNPLDLEALKKTFKEKFKNITKSK